MSAHSSSTPRAPLSLRTRWRGTALTLVLLVLSACEQADFRFASSRPASERFTIPDPPAGSPAAGCFDELASAHRDVGPDHAAREQAARLGPIAERDFRTRERERQREWDQRYCRRQAECRFLATPQASASDISDSVELCLNHRAQQRVAMGL